MRILQRSPLLGAGVIDEHVVELSVGRYSVVKLSVGRYGGTWQAEDNSGGGGDGGGDRNT
ncbi:MAG: hypothetical protein ACRDTA_29045 [Pseudonocardiaceae bacterium]